MHANRDAVLGVGGPLGAAPAEELVGAAFAAELDEQRGLVADVGLADLAHVIVLLECGALQRGDGAALLEALLALQAEPADFVLDPALGDVYTNREAWLSARTPAAGGLGLGRARREAVTTGYALAVRRAALGFARALLEAGSSLVDAAERFTETLFPDYTYGRAAQPTTFGHYLLGFAYPLLRDLERTGALFTRLDRCPAGCGITNGATIPFERARFAALLGFEGLVEHARDAMWQADLPMETTGAACAAAVNLDRLAEDLTLFSSAEFGFVAIADEHARASKAMPQKKNPYALAYVRAVANRAIGIQAGIAAAQRTPSGQMDSRLAAYGDVPRVLANVAGAATLLAAVVRGLRFDAAAGLRALRAASTCASDLAELIVREGSVDYRTAHALVGRLYRSVDGASGEARVPSVAAIDDAARSLLGRPLGLAPDALARALDPALAVARRAGRGGAAPAAVAAMIAECRGRLSEHANRIAGASARCSRSERDLLDVARRLASAR